jgi:Gpi18-like mannosyltransferase
MSLSAEADVPATALWLRVWRSPGVRWCVFLFLGLRLGLAGFALAARATNPGPFTPDPVLRPYVGVEPEKNPLLEPWQRWDTLYYQALAERGYSTFESSVFAPPLYPLLMRWAGWAVGGNTLLGGILVSNLAYLAALIYLYRLTRMEADDRQARYATLYLAIFPTAVFLLAAYTESLFLLTVVAAIYHARRKEWLLAGAWASLSPLIRVQGPVIAPALAYEAIRTWREIGMPRLKAVIGVALAGIGVLAYPAFAWIALHVSPPQLIVTHSQRFRGWFAVPGVAIFAALGLLVRGRFVQGDYFDLVATILFIGLTVLVFRWYPSVYGVYSLLMLMLILSKSSDFEALVSMSRYVLAIFPGFMALGRLGSSKPWVHRLILYPSIAGLMYATGQFVIWGWIA